MAPRLVGVAPGPPLAVHTFSGISAGLLQALDRRGCLAGAIDGRPRTLQMLEQAASFDRDGRRWRQWYYGGLPIAGPTLRELTSAVARRRTSRMAAITNADAVLQLAGWYRPHVGGLFRASYHDGNLAVYLERPDLAIPRQAARVGRGFAWERRLYDSIDVIFTMSEWLRASFISDFGQSPDKVVAVGAGANFSALPAPAERDWTTPRFLFVGRDWERKGGPNLLRAWPALRRARPDATLRIVGPTAIPEALPAGVEFVGRLDPSTPEGQAAFDTAYREATAFVMPSLFEPFGIVFLEAMAHGLPCVAADRCAMPEIVHDHVTGRIAAPEDPGALAEALISVADPHTACRMGVAGRERMREQFTWEAVADRILAEIEARLPVAQVGRRQGARDRGLRR